jgi:hypothetical protein
MNPDTERIAAIKQAKQLMVERGCCVRACVNCIGELFHTCCNLAHQVVRDSGANYTDNYLRRERRGTRHYGGASSRKTNCDFDPEVPQ